MSPVERGENLSVLPDEDYRKAYENAIALLRSLHAGEEYNSIGFLATRFPRDNYRRLFARDAFWMIFADILTDDNVLIEGTRNSIATLAKHQREDGAIPSNVSPEGAVSYGVINPRIDPTSLYIIGCGRFAKRHPGEGIIERYLASLGKAVSYLEKKWENAECGLLYIPRAGNWADEYLQQGFVLYDEVLWHMALREYADMLEASGGREGESYRAKAEKVKRVILDKFWASRLEGTNENIYTRLKKKFDLDKTGYFIHFYFSSGVEESSFRHPCGIFDAFGNILAILCGVASDEEAPKIIEFIDEISLNKYPLVPAHYPFFPEEVFRSARLYQYRFKQFVGHFHNGGLWAWYTGPYVAALVKCGYREKALKFLTGILKANYEKKDEMDFYEYHTGKRAIAYLKVVHLRGIDFYPSKAVSDFVSSKKSMVLVHFGKEKVDAESDILLRALNVKKNEKIKVTAVGPDSEEVLTGISGLVDSSGRKLFRLQDMFLMGSTPGGTPYLGVSAAAYIIAYEALFNNKILFDKNF